MRKVIRILLYIAGIVVLLLAAAYFIAGPLVQRRVDAALRQLPASLRVTYSSLDLRIFSGSVAVRGVEVKFVPLADTAHRHRVTVGTVEVSGVRLWALLSSKALKAADLKAGECVVELDDYLLEKDIPFPKIESPFTSVSIKHIVLADVRLEVNKGKAKTVFLRGGATVDENRKGELRIDSLRLWPGVGKTALGRLRGHQVDWLEASSRDIRVSGLDVAALSEHRLTADEISIGHTRIYVFRDRRLPLEPGKKPMPAEVLKRLPMEVRVRSVRLGPSSFTYEEFPKKGDSTGILKILRLRCTVAPLINRPKAGDPAYVAIKSEGSLMGSGTVEAVTRVPLHKDEAYEVEGAFHQLDVTKLNPSAENLGDIHLESGMLNSLDFAFRMDTVRATGRIVGEYHNLVADKLKGKGSDKKVDKLKSWFLKKLIIPRNKDKSLPVAKRTGKVDYKRDPERYFSYYLLHSLLVGVKDSFTLGFLLPG